MSAMYNVKVYYKGEQVGSAEGVPFKYYDAAIGYARKMEKREGVECEPLYPNGDGVAFWREDKK